ncbi:MAG: hypothetical protein ACYTE6_16000 [Planctomycetota bacterium]|jgi:hypothetical protein
MRVTILLVVCVIPLLVAGCKSEEKQDPPPVVSAPLALDPTEDLELPAWWTNGAELLHLGEADSYALYEGVNRYRKPAQRGHWSQLSYAAIRLEPYEELDHETVRGSIQRVGRTLRLSLPGLDPMRGLDGPPPVMEDRLVGWWTAEFGTLRLNDNMRYVLTLDPEPPRPPAVVTKHAGAWQVEDDIVILRPDSAGVGSVLVRIRESDDVISLEAPDGPLARRAPLIEGG